MKRLFPILLASIFVWAGCIQETEGPYEDSRFIKDEYGRTLILHGFNSSGDAKYGDYLPWITEDYVEMETNSWGMNVARYLTSWESLEPDSGVFNESHLDSIEQRINWYTDRGAYIIIDMHQDVYGPAVGGNGHPEWATETNGYVFGQNGVEYPVWWLNNLDPATQWAYQNFWQYSNHKYLQDHYIMTWMKVVERFKDNPRVIGYDLMNEPHAGDLSRTFNTSFEKFQLKPFYDRLIEAIRQEDPEKYIFFEAQSFTVNFGLYSTLPKLEDPRPGERRLVYAPHCYPLFVDLVGEYNTAAEDHLAIWETSRNIELDRHQAPLLVGEVGLSANTPGFDRYLKDFTAMADRMQASWTYWSNDPGSWGPVDGSLNETPILQELIRTYPRAIAGRLLNFEFDPETKVFELTFINDSDISMPTEIFIPQRFYEGGWDIEVIGTDLWSQDWNPVTQVLSFNSTSDDVEITVKIRPD